MLNEKTILFLSTGATYMDQTKTLWYPLTKIFKEAINYIYYGVTDFHLRPVGWDNLTKTKGTSISFNNLDEINEQISKAMELESDTFHVYGIRHKFNDDFSRKVGFKKCWAIPLIITMCADGNVYLCFDRRGDETQILCSHYPDVQNVLKYWNSEHHKQLVNDVKVNECPRCTFHAYNEMVEQVFIEDKMCKMFP